ncbi:MAG TPA: hypothetical protein VFN94_04965, partial [Nitrospiria bacterium]|nr:hypothetical protein [Nitrospiria bacterium]
CNVRVVSVIAALLVTLGLGTVTAWGPVRVRLDLLTFLEMMSEPHPHILFLRFLSRMAVVSTMSVVIVTLGLMILTACTRQAQVAARWAQVMPFDLEQTIHVFQRLEDGGRQTVTVKDPSNTQQIALIQSHLQHEAERFRQGDFSDPAKIHGHEMPGLAELKAGFAQIDIRYTALPNGGEI